MFVCGFLWGNYLSYLGNMGELVVQDGGIESEIDTFNLILLDGCGLDTGLEGFEGSFFFLFLFFFWFLLFLCFV